MKHTGSSYDGLAARYADANENKPINVFLERPALVSLLPPLQGTSVLDAGCGPGWFAEHCQTGGAAITAFDFNTDFVNQTRDRLNHADPESHADVFEADLSLPLEMLSDDSFDLVLCSLVLHYLEDWIPVFDEFMRVLKPTGRLLFSTHHPANDWIGFETDSYFDVELLEDEWDIGRVEFFRRPITKICDDLHQTGFVIERLVEPQPLVAWREVDPESYERFNNSPWRLMIRARKS